MSGAPGCLIYYDPERQVDLPGQVGARCRMIDVTAAATAGEAACSLAELGLSAADDLPVLMILAGDAWGGGGFAARRLRVLAVGLAPSAAARLAAGGGYAATRVVVYGSSECSDCKRARRVLDEAQVSYDQVDLERDARAEALVLRRSGGRRVVPTVQFDDRIWAFNPEPALIRRLLGRGTEPARR